MKTSSHTVTIDQVQILEPQGKLKEPRTVDGQNLLSPVILRVASNVISITDRKPLAQTLKVSESILSRWASGSKPIPTERVFEIIKAGKLFCSSKRREIQNIEDEIDLMMATQFGRVE